MSERHSIPDNPCLDCGACCVTYRVSFYWAEADALGLPEHLTEQLTPVYGCMAGTNRAQPRCVLLKGEVGREVACGDYERRPSACREVQAGDDKCRKARLRHGMLPLEVVSV